MNLNEDLRHIVDAQGLDYFGIADLCSVRVAVLKQGGHHIAGFPAAISVGIRLMDSIVNLLPKQDELAVKVSYRHHAYEVINFRLDLVASVISGYLQRLGFRAFPIPASKQVDDRRLCADFSHKLAAHLAGLGWIGKSCLLITREHGPRIRWATVLTDAPVEPTGKTTEQQCGDCRECVDICPVRAFTGKPFRKSESREARFDARRCTKYLEAIKKNSELRHVVSASTFVPMVGRRLRQQTRSLHNRLPNHLDIGSADQALEQRCAGTEKSDEQSYNGGQQ